MAYIAPNTRVKLIKGCNIPSDGKHTLYFASRAAQTAFFESLQGVTFNDYSFQRGTDGTDKIRVGASYGSLYGCSYMLFNNESFLDKNFYAFILDIRYVNNETCDIYYRIDNIQTWLFDITLLPSYIERTHDDGTGRGLLTDEGLSPGEMELQGSTLININDFGSANIPGFFNTKFCVLIQTTLDLEKANKDNYPANADLNDYRISAIYTRDGNMIDGVGTFMVPIDDSFIGPSFNFAGFLRVYNWIYTNGFSDALICMWVYPTTLMTYTSVYSGHLPTQDVWTVTGVKTDSTIVDVSLPTIPIDQNNKKLVGGMVVKNSKLTKYPFTQMLVTNNNGSAVTYRCEDFGAPDSPKARVSGTSTAEAKIRLTPINYGENTVPTVVDTDLAIDTAPAPFVSYVNDPYSVWLAQNRNTIENNFDTMQNRFIRQQAGTVIGGMLKAADAGAKGGAGAAAASLASTTFDVVSNTASAIEDINAIVAASEDMRQRPATASGVQSVGLSIQNNKGYFSAGIVQPRTSRILQLDDYFTMFGYRQDRIMNINLKVRSEFTYIKTAGCNIRSNIPKDIESEIAARFDNGIFWWVNNSNMCDFSVSNNFLT